MQPIHGRKSVNFFSVVNPAIRGLARRAQHVMHHALQRLPLQRLQNRLHSRISHRSHAPQRVGMQSVTLQRHATQERCRMNSHAGAWEL